MSSRQHNLLLCMTPGIGLSNWRDNGNLDRELKPYEEYVRRGWQVCIATYDSDSCGPVPTLPEGLSVFQLRNYPRCCWINFGPLAARMRNAHVVKTNQAGGAWWYGLAARSARRPFLLRCGWLPGRHFAERNISPVRLQPMRFFERLAFRRATACHVATAADRSFVCSVYGVKADRVHVQPNWIDTALFHPSDQLPIARTVVYAGRFVPVKRLDLMVKACHLARVNRLILVGDGPERENLQRLAGELGVALEFPGVKPQAELPFLLRKGMVFALTSQVEGQPKALFEAMACGVPCLGAQVSGISEAIVHERTGLLAAPSPEALAHGLTRLFEDSGLRERLASRALEFVRDNLSFKQAMDAELDLVTQLAEDAGC